MTLLKNEDQGGQDLISMEKQQNFLTEAYQRN